MSLLQEIQDGVTGTHTISESLRKTLILAYRLGNNDLKQWVRQELDGYQEHSVELPDYRVQQTPILGDFIHPRWTLSSVEVPLEVLPENVRDDFQLLVIDQGVSGLEAMRDSIVQNNLPYFRRRLPPGLAHYLSNRVYPYAECVDVWYPITEVAIVSILDTIRTRLLTMLLEMVEQYPDAAQHDFVETGINPSSAQISHLFQYFIQGGQNAFVAGPYPENVKGMITMQEMNIGDGNTIHGNLTIAHAIENSFNAITQASVSDDIKKLLQQIVAESKTIIDVIPPEKGQQVANDVQNLAREVTSEEPRHAWIQLSADGLKQAAENIGAIGAPLIELLNKLLPLLAEN